MYEHEEMEKDLAKLPKRETQRVQPEDPCYLPPIKGAASNKTNEVEMVPFREEKKNEDAPPI